MRSFISILALVAAATQLVAAETDMACAVRSRGIGFFQWI